MFHILLMIIYLSFISLGLPDSVLGASWPIMYEEFSVPISYAGVVSMIIAFGTIISSLQSDRLTRKLGAGLVTAISVAMTAVALMGFSFSKSFVVLCLWAIPYGLGAGSVDAALNNYVALHYASRHMSWLHCMWGVGTVIGPTIMGIALTNGMHWNNGYLYISFLQMGLSAVLVLSLPLWKKQGIIQPDTEEGSISQNDETDRALSLREILGIKGAKEVMVTFSCYCALESTALLWGSSFLVLHKGVSEETGALLAMLFTIGITVGRAINGFLTMKFGDDSLIRMGQGIIAVGIAAILLPFGNGITFAGLVLVGLGCAPIYPSIIHSTPIRFGADKSQALIGVQMASAYVGSCLMPPVFGLIANHIHVKYFSIYLLILLLLMITMHEKLIKTTK